MRHLSSISRQAKRQKRSRLPDADSTWDGRLLLRAEARPIRARLQEQLSAMAMRWRSNLGEPTNAA
jgi:hypothetical protein